MLDQTINAIELSDITLTYDDRIILDQVSFAVRPGETKILMGGSGTGKSTVLKLVLGLIKPDAGRIRIDGEDITDFSERELAVVRRKIGMVFQEGALFDSLSVYQNVGYRLFEQGMDEDQIREEVRQKLQFVNLEHAIDMMPAELSGGMRRRVGIARALVGNPRLILYDEPTAGLDPPTARTICELAMELRDLQSVSSIFVTHRMGDARLMSSAYFTLNDYGEPIYKREDDTLCLINTQFIMLKDGRVIFSGTDETLWDIDDPYIQNFLREV